MPSMTRDEILHLASLIRIKLTEEELADFEKELPSILEYVSVVSDIAGDEKIEPELGAQFNVLREDAITVESGSFTDSIVAEMPDSKDGYLKVKKILQTGE